MKARLGIFLLSIALGAGVAAYGEGKAAAPKPAADEGRISVVFQDPDKFTDVKDGVMESDSGRDSILEELKKYIQERTVEILGAGQKLTIVFTDIDLAGEYEPWRMPPMDGIRVVKSIYPPRMDFRFKVIDGSAAGVTLREGKEELRDLAFQDRLTIHRDDPLRYEKDMLLTWMRTTLSGLKSGK